MKQQRNTKQRQLILDVVKSHHDHPSADQLYLQLRGMDDKISRGTVYRNLNLLVENGEILHVKVPGVDRFESRLDFHYHLICGQCGKVVDVSLPYHTDLDQSATEESGFEISRHRTIFEGICPECKKK